MFFSKRKKISVSGSLELLILDIDNYPRKVKVLLIVNSYRTIDCKGEN